MERRAGDGTPQRSARHSENRISAEREFRAIERRFRCWGKYASPRRDIMHAEFRANERFVRNKRLHDTPVG